MTELFKKSKEFNRKQVFSGFYRKVKNHLADLEVDLQDCQEQAKANGNRLEAFHVKTDLLLLLTVRNWINSRVK